MKDRDRTNLLKKFWPDMPSQRRSDLNATAAWRAPTLDKLRAPWPLPDTPASRAQDNIMLYPEFSTDALANHNSTFLQLMESRANSHPQIFSKLDLVNPVNVNLQEARKFILPKARPVKTGMTFAELHRFGNPDNYGQLVVSRNPQESQTLSDLEFNTVNEGNRVLDVQEKIYTLLEGICGDLTDEKNNKRYAARDEDTETAWKPVPVEDPQEVNKEQELREYLQLHHDLQPYSEPDNVDWDYIVALSETRLRIAENTLIGIKESPAKFVNWLMETRNHDPRMLLTADGIADELVRGGKDLMNGTRMASYLADGLVMLINRIEIWQRIYTLAVQSIQPEVTDDVVTTRDYHANIFAILCVAPYYNNFRDHFITAIQASPGMRDFFSKEADDYLGTPFTGKGKLSLKEASNVRQRNRELLTSLIYHSHCLSLLKTGVVWDIFAPTGGLYLNTLLDLF